MGVIGLLLRHLIRTHTIVSDVLPLVVVFNFGGAFFFFILYLAIGADASEPEADDKTRLTRACADTYILAWQHYQKYEVQMQKAWLFQSDQFMKNVKQKCVERAFNERYDHVYKGCCFFIPVSHKDREGTQWKISVLKQEILSPASIQAVADMLPDLTAAFDFELAAKATNAELIQQAIPQRDDPRTTTMHMPVWNEEDQTWNMHEVKRRAAT
nr:MAG TPA: hypothetical protein [Caudoviricetes sp.]